MASFRRGTSATGTGFSWTAILALYLIVQIKPTKPMAEEQVFCNGTFYHYNNHEAFVMSVKAMRNCTVLEGGLHISFLNLSRTSEIWDNYVMFPNLREISGFLLIHKSEGFESLSQLFPNLSVIRGEPPLRDKNLHTSLCITDNIDLKRIGLNIAVLNGSVHIRGNKHLCPGGEIDSWKKYVEIDIQNNMPALKNSSDIPWWCQGNYSAPTWPSPPSISCHELCLGGCTGQNSSDCYVCRTFQYQGTCVTECPPAKRLSLPSHRCIDEQGCEQRGSLDIFPNLKENEESARFLPRNKSCLPGCRESFEPRYEYGFMKCKKLCSPGKIQYAYELDEYRNCTYTPTSLKILPAIDCEKFNITEWESALERNLGAIRTINGSLIIRRLHGVENLHFLRSLEVINTRNDTEFSILIDDNALINQLFTESVSKRLKIRPKKGYFVTINNNPKLCSKEILLLEKVLPSSVKLLASNNGRKAQCNDTFLPVEPRIYNINATSAVVEWNPAYFLSIVYTTLYFRQAPHPQNVSFSGMNFPSTDSWDTLEVFNNRTDNITFSLNKLSASSRYAVYIEGIGEANVLRSKMRYFWTKSLRSRPCTVSAWPYPSILYSESALKIEWAGPAQTPDESPFEYLIIGEYVKETNSPCSSMHFRQLNFSDYCTVLKQLKPWDCPVSESRQIVEPCNSNEFSTILDTFLEKPKSAAPTNKFSYGVNLSITPHILPLAKIVVKNETDTGKSTGRLTYFAVITRTEAVVVRNLMPFGNYQIRVYTCSIQQGNLQNMSWESRCSQPSFGSGRSSAVENADTLLLSPFAIPANYSSSFVLQWGKGKVTNSLAWHTVKITDETNEQETLCIEGDEMRFENKPAGVYNICVTVESMLKSGETRCISYRVAVTHPWGSFFFVLFGVTGVILAVGFVIRRIQQFKSEDRVVLLREESLDSDVRFSEIPVNDLEIVLL